MKETVLRFLQKEIDAEHIPGAVVHVSYKGEVVLQESIGSKVVYPEKSPMKLDTVFDLASLTKVVATLPAILKLLDEGEIRLDDRVAYFLPDFARKNKEAITIKQLLTHSSGLPAHKPYFEEDLNREEVLENIYNQELEYVTDHKVVYSDLGLITLYKLVEVVTGQRFDEFVMEEILTPLEMVNSGFNPKFDRDRYAATEYSEKRKDYKFGIVHDDNTESMGGISGHAGLFSTIHDLQNFATMIENDGIFKGKRILSRNALDISRKNYTSFASEYRGLGWILKSPNLSSCGDYFSDLSYGHTGFTGTSIWFDPSVDLHVILLTNRVHFGRKPPIIRLRPRLHNIIRSHF
ncbi:CubicO group peptidase, beta-lactamase class C family [Oceanobacillus limi]|uniref:CubicO group peptidase, beta-lactamase class C family n=1 Tax=Oceanobacillus limi TaxID=930131 RepID=A0A1I0BL50_9BACI|nr:serine hydrolase domain-containing protein [Oceanobacillus limi]SET06997.1 CubicO group peptidase, beta-lactamase class C family [Oceanobacillus limi]